MKPNLLDIIPAAAPSTVHVFCMQDLVLVLVFCFFLSNPISLFDV